MVVTMTTIEAFQRLGVALAIGILIGLPLDRAGGDFGQSG